MRAHHPLLFLLPLLLCLLPPVPGSAQEGTVIFLVRHAERADDGGMVGQEDPHLSEAGRVRASLLARILRDSGLTHIHSTDYLRTRETAAPLAEETGLSVNLYDPLRLEGLVETLRATPGRHLVVGHSNTTPQVVAALGGEPHSPIRPMEYDRLYLIHLVPGGVETVLLRFGTSLP